MRDTARAEALRDAAADAGVVLDVRASTSPTRRGRVLRRGGAARPWADRRARQQRRARRVGTAEMLDMARPRAARGQLPGPGAPDQAGAAGHARGRLRAGRDRHECRWGGGPALRRRVLRGEVRGRGVHAVPRPRRRAFRGVGQRHRACRGRLRLRRQRAAPRTRRRPVRRAARRLPPAHRGRLRHRPDARRRRRAIADLHHATYRFRWQTSPRRPPSSACPSPTSMASGCSEPPVAGSQRPPTEPPLSGRAGPGLGRRRADPGSGGDS